MKNSNVKYLLFISFCLVLGISLVIYKLPSEIKMDKYLSSKEKLKKNNTALKIAKIIKISTKDKAQLSRIPANQNRYVERPRPVKLNKVKSKKVIQKQKVQSVDIQRKKEIISDSIQPEKFINQEVAFSKLDNIYAIKPEDFMPNQYEILEERNGYYIVAYSGDIPDNALAVVKNEDSGNFVIFTGILRVKFFDYANSEQLFVLINENAHNSELNIDGKIKDEYEYIRTASYQFDDYESTINSFEILNSSRLEGIIERVTIDLVEWKRSSN